MAVLNTPPAAASDVESSHPLTESRATTPHDNPEQLVRNETWWINCMRGVLIGTLVVVAAGTAWAAYGVSSKWEYHTFLSAYQNAADRITTTFLKQTNLQLWIANFAINTLVTVNASPPLTDVSVDRFNSLFRGGQRIANMRRMGYSPLLRNNQERDIWEAYASQAYKSVNATQNICHICGDGMEVGDLNALVAIPTVGSFPCQTLQSGGLQGVIDPTNCKAILAYTVPQCNCQPSSANAATQAQNSTPDVAVASHIFRILNDTQVDFAGPGPSFPVWRLAPNTPIQSVLYDQLSVSTRRRALLSMMKSKFPTFSETAFAGEYERLLQDQIQEPLASIFLPVFDANATSKIIGTFFVDFCWSYILSLDVPEESNGFQLVIENTRGQAFTYQIQNSIVSFLGAGDLHDIAFDSLMRESTYEAFVPVVQDLAATPSSESLTKQLYYNMRVYPSNACVRRYRTNRPLIYAVVVVAIFIFTSTMFLMYDLLVRRRQTKVMASAMQTDAIVSSLFPESIRARLVGNGGQSKQNLSSAARKRNKSSPLHFAAPKSQLKTMLQGKSNMAQLAFSIAEPIADFFPYVTVVFADISGFTAWSSEREPAQVFQLLEAAYQTFDKIANKLGVFKIETIGDCYVAVTGLPEPQADHAVRMARFAYEIMLHMHELVSSLESMLGPGTGSLSIRIGMHSGPVIGGVLRGEKARFQLFGDTMNTAARMQSTGQVNMIQVSDATAKLILQAGQTSWLRKRDDPVLVKGKGEMQTFWVSPTFDNSPAGGGSGGYGSPTILTDSSPYSSAWGDVRIESALNNRSSLEDKFDRLVNWNTDLLMKFLQKVVAVRTASKRSKLQPKYLLQQPFPSFSEKPLDDVTEVISMTDFCEKTADGEMDSESIQIGEAVCLQLRDYVERIAAMYRDNPFHNFEHASHVAMSASKIVKRIVKPEGVDYHQQSIRKKYRKKAVAQQIHQSTFGISSDALMQFAVIFSAVIHDVDHRGISNAQMVKEADEVAVKFDDKCVLEQNSVQIAWNLLMEEQYEDLRACIFSNEHEKLRFRQLIVNAVIATDIADKELQALRKNRWNKAFYEQFEMNPDHSQEEDISCKATVVFEYIIQASDVAHTMQHWQIYNKWNERLFEERYLAFLAGREEKDPSLSWYDGEIWFFDNYIIPLARKLETCGVFGVSSDEYLNYALENRHEWGRKGQSIVEGLVEKYRSKVPPNVGDVTPESEEKEEELDK